MELVLITVQFFAGAANLFAGTMMIVDAVIDKTLKNFLIPGIIFVVAAICWFIGAGINMVNYF